MTTARRFEDLEQWQQMRIDFLLTLLPPEVRSAIDLVGDPRAVEPVLRRHGFDELEAAAGAELALRPRTRARYRVRRLGQLTN